MENWKQVESIVDQALTLPKAERATFIDTECKENESLKSQVTLLLESIANSEGWLENPKDYREAIYDDIAEDVDELSVRESLIGRTVGAYTIKKKLVRAEWDRYTWLYAPKTILITRLPLR